MYDELLTDNPSAQVIYYLDIFAVENFKNTFYASVALYYLMVASASVI